MKRMGDCMFEHKYRDLLNELLEGNQSALLTYMNPDDSRSGDIHRKTVLSNEEEFNKIGQDIKEQLDKAFLTGSPVFYQNNEESVLIEPYYPKPRLIIFGGGH